MLRPRNNPTLCHVGEDNSITFPCLCKDEMKGGIVMETFVNEFLTRINGQVADSELPVIAEQLSILCGNYEIKRKETALVPYEELPEAYKAYMVTLKIEGKSDKTLAQYRLRLEPLFKTIRKPLDDITTNDLRIYLYQIKQQRGIADITLDNIRAVFNAFFAWCSEEGYIKKNVCAAIHPIKYEKKPRKIYTDTQLEVMRTVCTSDRDRAIIEVLYSTGCRVGELAVLKRSDIDFSTRKVQLYGKGKKHRFSCINARAEVALKKYLASRDDDNEALFVSMRKPHNALGIREFQNIIKKLGEKAQIEKACPHRMRHTFATVALEHGMPITDLQQLMGHNNLDTTMIYAKVSQTGVAMSHSKCIA